MKRTDAWHKRRAAAVQAEADKLVQMVFHAGVPGLTFDRVAELAGLTPTSAQRRLAWIVSRGRLIKASRHWKDGKRELGAYVHPTFFEAHMAARTREQEKAKRMSRPEQRRDQDRVRFQILELVRESGIPGITGPMIADQTGIEIKRVRAVLAHMRIAEEIVAGRHNRNKGQDGTRWVMPGMRHRNIEYWEQQESAPPRPISPEALKRRLAREEKLSAWGDQLPVQRVVPHGEWKAAPIKAPRTVFELAA
jgi:hypothetical protein